MRYFDSQPSILISRARNSRGSFRAGQETGLLPPHAERMSPFLKVIFLLELLYVLAGYFRRLLNSATETAWNSRYFREGSVKIVNPELLPNVF